MKYIGQHTAALLAATLVISGTPITKNPREPQRRERPEDNFFSNVVPKKKSDGDYTRIDKAEAKRQRKQAKRLGK